MADYPKQLRERITKFREQKGVSESRMSRELGQSKCYLQQISSGKTLPSMGAFFRICEYLETLPIEFFWDDGIDSIYILYVENCGGSSSCWRRRPWRTRQGFCCLR